MARALGSELAAFLVANGLLSAVPDDLSDLDARMVTAWGQFARRTSWVFMLAEDEDSVTPFQSGSVIDRILNLPSGYVSITSIKRTSTTLEEGIHYRLLPQNAPDFNEAYSAIEFFSDATEFMPLTITGKRGRFTDPPDGMNEVVIQMAAADFAETAMTTDSLVELGGVKRLKQGPVEYEFGADSLASVGGKVNAWKKAANQGIMEFTRVLV